jgi:hypothetical protein
MTTLARITIAFLIAVFLSSCAFDMNWEGKKGNGVVVEDERHVESEFTMVTASEGIDVFVTQANDFEIHLEADENIIDLIGTDIRDGELRIHAIENIGRATKKVYVSLPMITNLESSSGAELTVKDVIEADKLSLSASSGSDLHIVVNADEVEADTSSGADIHISGEANIFHADASSGSDIKARDFQVKTCYADASSGADISVHVSQNLTADASSGGNISYDGEASVKKNKAVSGSVHKY